MLFVIIGKWKAEKTDEVIDRLVNRKVPLPEEFKAVEYYQLLGKHMAVVIGEAPDEATVAKSAINFSDVMEELEYCPAMPMKDYIQMRTKLLK
jgi:uncharacterized protein with GYD domain